RLDWRAIGRGNTCGIAPPGWSHPVLPSGTTSGRCHRASDRRDLPNLLHKARPFSRRYSRPTQVADSLAIESGVTQVSTLTCWCTEDDEEGQSRLATAGEPPRQTSERRGALSPSSQ